LRQVGSYWDTRSELRAPNVTTAQALPIYFFPLQGKGAYFGTVTSGGRGRTRQETVPNRPKKNICNNRGGGSVSNRKRPRRKHRRLEQRNLKGGQIETFSKNHLVCNGTRCNDSNGAHASAQTPPAASPTPAQQQTQLQHSKARGAAAGAAIGAVGGNAAAAVIGADHSRREQRRNKSIGRLTMHRTCAL
jgi:hypothetical protein